MTDSFGRAACWAFSCPICSCPPAGIFLEHLVGFHGEPWSRHPETSSGLRWMKQKEFELDESGVRAYPSALRTNLLIPTHRLPRLVAPIGDGLVLLARQDVWNACRWKDLIPAASLGSIEYLRFCPTDFDRTLAGLVPAFDGKVFPGAYHTAHLPRASANEAPLSQYVELLPDDTRPRQRGGSPIPHTHVLKVGAACDRPRWDPQAREFGSAPLELIRERGLVDAGHSRYASNEFVDYFIPEADRRYFTNLGEVYSVEAG